MQRLDPNDPTVHLQLKVPEKLRTRLMALAKRRGLTLSDFVRRLLDDALEADRRSRRGGGETPNSAV